MSAVLCSLEAALGTISVRSEVRTRARFCRPLHRRYTVSQEVAVRNRKCSAQSFVAQRAVAASSSSDPLLGDLNRLSDRALRSMLTSNEKEASELAMELSTLRELLLEEHQELQGSTYIKVLQGLLHHTLFKEADNLEGQWKRAFDQIANQVAGCDWSVTEPGKTSGAPQEEPKFSTWDEALSNKQPSSAASARDSPAVVDETLYRRLGVSVIAPPAGLKAAYRREALKTHPDVSDAPDAQQRFAELSEAYDVLSDSETRSIYDKQGLEGLKRARGAAAAGPSNASKAWDEFKPFTKSNKRTQARSSSAQVADSGLEERHTDSLPAMGDVVEYPLRELERDGRDKGVGLLVGRNMDRGDAATLPADTLDLCEIEPLRQEEEGSTRWLPDELGDVSFVRLQELTSLPVAEYDGRYDIWTIDVPLSEGCSGPALPEEIML
ncbi:hypothetical protein WJX74_003834 [Apatococcus lobatus]|uniref:J domain-containing protein n=1 Tax=Apatococcus lobatus TaxID=904363 RepID=A0AAW1SB71_9CHLO